MDPSRGSRDRRQALIAAVGGRRARAVVVNAFILSLAVAAIAVAQGAEDGGVGAAASRQPGDAIELGRRNPSSGDVAAESAIVADVGNDGLALRLTNNATGGRANSSTCNNTGVSPTDGCHVYVNKGTGIVASFRSAGNGVAPFAVRNTNDGRVDNLNSHYVNGNQVSCPDGTQLIGGVCAETALRDGGAAVTWEVAAAGCRNADRRLPTYGESALIGKVLGAAPFGVDNWADDTGRDGGAQTAALVRPAGETQQVLQTNPHQYRCVVSPISPKPATPAP
jgi:hypothetical protein